jgi:hypothetical protein
MPFNATEPSPSHAHHGTILARPMWVRHVYGTPLFKISWHGRLRQNPDQPIHRLRPSLFGFAAALVMKGAFVLPVWISCSQLCSQLTDGFRLRVAEPSFSCRISSVGLCASFLLRGIWIFAIAVRGRLRMDPFVRSRNSTQYRRIFLLSDNTLPLADFVRGMVSIL